LTFFQIPNNKPFIISEIANTHTGSFKKLETIVKKTIETNTDAIKFQFFKSTELLVPNHPEYNLFQSLEFTNSQWMKIFKLLKKYNIKICIDVFSIERAKFANKLGTDIFKIHSSDIGNFSLIKYLATTNKPIILSCSGCKINEIDDAIKIIKTFGISQIILMHGFQGFPTNISDINLSRILTLQKRYDLPVGYSDHVDGGSDYATYLPLVALGMNAFIIEKHITINRDLKEEDYESAINPNEFKKFVKIFKKLSKGIGNSSLELFGSEIEYRKRMKKIPVSKTNLPKNYKIKLSDISLKRLHNYHSGLSVNQLLNSTTTTNIKKNSELYEKNTRLLKNKTAAILACRIGSTRLFAKPLQQLGHGTILETLIQQLNQSKLINEIVLAISNNPGNEIFVDFARKNNLRFVLGDDKDVQKRLIDAADLVQADIIFRVTTEDPFVYWEIIDDAIKQHILTKVDLTFVPQLPEGTGFELISTAALKKSHKHGNSKTRSELVTEYMHQNQRQFKFKSYDVSSRYHRPDVRLTVDNPEDLILVRKIFDKLNFNKKIPTLKKILELIQNHPELLEINKKYTDQSYRNWI
jgi:N,N'-diacetyllegionaminate synthase